MGARNDEDDVGMGSLILTGVLTWAGFKMAARLIHWARHKDQALTAENMPAEPTEKLQTKQPGVADSLLLIERRRQQTVGIGISCRVVLVCVFVAMVSACAPFVLFSGEAQNMHKRLGISRSSSTADVKRAFRQLSRTVHPDKVLASEKEQAEERFGLIQEAHDTLTNTKKADAFEKHGFSGLQFINDKICAAQARPARHMHLILHCLVHRIIHCGQTMLPHLCCFMVWERWSLVSSAR